MNINHQLFFSINKLKLIQEKLYIIYMKKIKMNLKILYIFLINIWLKTNNNNNNNNYDNNNIIKSNKNLILFLKKIEILINKVLIITSKNQLISNVERLNLCIVYPTCNIFFNGKLSNRLPLFIKPLFIISFKTKGKVKNHIDAKSIVFFFFQKKNYFIFCCIDGRYSLLHKFFF